MQPSSAMLAPVIALVLWTFVMWTWMYVTRIPAIIRIRMRLDPNAPRGQQMNELPAQVRWKADNYNHLFTQVPCWKLPQAHALLRQRGITARMEVQPGYASVLRMAAAG